jgi:hypothetical protein
MDINAGILQTRNPEKKQRIPASRRKDTASNVNSKATLRRIVPIGKRKEINPHLTPLKHVPPTFLKQ